MADGGWKGLDAVENTHFKNRIKQMMGSTVRPLWSVEDLLEGGMWPQSNGDRCDKTTLIWTALSFLKGCGGGCIPYCAPATDNLKCNTLLVNK